MEEVLAAVGAMLAVLFVSYLLGRQKKRDGLLRVETQPGNVARIYLRPDADIDACWLHAEMKNGKKACIAAPWEIADTLMRLEPLGLRLSAEDRAALGQ